REIAGLGSLEDLVDVDGCASGLLEEVRYIGHQATLPSVVLVLEHRGEPELNRAVQDPPAVKEEERIIQREERIGTLSRQGGQGSIELLNGFLYLYPLERNAQKMSRALQCRIHTSRERLAGIARTEHRDSRDMRNRLLEQLEIFRRP